MSPALRSASLLSGSRPPPGTVVRTWPLCRIGGVPVVYLSLAANAAPPVRPSMTSPPEDSAARTASEAQARLLRAALGDRAAFEALYRSTSSALLAVCLRLMPDRAEAEDVLQDAFVAIWHKADQYDPQKASAMTWLIAIVRNKAIDRMRSGGYAFKRASIELPEELDDGEPTPAARAEAVSEAELLRTCMEALEPRRRQLIRTAFYEGTTYEELAQRTGSPVGSVKSWIRRGLLQLRACLEQ